MQVVLPGGVGVGGVGRVVGEGMAQRLLQLEDEVALAGARGVELECEHRLLGAFLDRGPGDPAVAVRPGLVDPDHGIAVGRLEVGESDRGALVVGDGQVGDRQQAGPVNAEVERDGAADRRAAHVVARAAVDAALQSVFVDGAFAARTDLQLIDQEAGIDCRVTFVHHAEADLDRPARGEGVGKGQIAGFLVPLEIADVGERRIVSVADIAQPDDLVADDDKGKVLEGRGVAIALALQEVELHRHDIAGMDVERLPDRRTVGRILDVVAGVAVVGNRIQRARSQAKEAFDVPLVGVLAEQERLLVRIGLRIGRFDAVDDRCVAARQHRPGRQVVEMLEHVRRLDAAFSLAQVVLDLLEQRAVILDHQVDRLRRMVAVVVADADVDQRRAVDAQDGEGSRRGSPDPGSAGD